MSPHLEPSPFEPQPGELPPPLAAPPSTPPGFAPPGQVPTLNGQPLAAPRIAGGRGPLAAAAFFAVLLLIGIGGAVRYFGGRVTSTRAEVHGDEFALPPVVVSEGPDEPVESATPRPVPRPVTYRGSGDKVLRLTGRPAEPSVVYLKVAPPKFGFASVTATSNGTPSGFVAVLRAAPYEGVYLLDSFSRATALHITTDGAWTVQVRALRSVPAFRGGVLSGHGAGVYRYTGVAGRATIITNGETQFVVKAYQRDNLPFTSALLVGSGRATKAWPAGPAYFSVDAAGSWTFSVS